MTLQDVIKTVYRKNHIGGPFSEWVTFIPKSGDAQRRIKVSITNRSRKQISDTTQDDEDEFTIVIGRDPTDTEIGGVRDLFVADGIKRDVDKDTNETALYFNGDNSEQGEHYHRAVFVRTRRVAQGKNR